MAKRTKVTEKHLVSQDDVSGGLSGEFSNGICEFSRIWHILMKSVYMKRKKHVHSQLCYQMC